MVMRTQKEIRQRAPLWLIALLITNFVLMTYDARDQATKQRVIRMWVQTAAAPFQNAVSGVGGTSVGFFDRIANLTRASSENELLKQRLTEMEIKLREAQAAQNENQRLQELLGLREEKDYSIIPARVIARDASAWFNTVTINRGRSMGVELRMPVVAGNSIVGRVVALNALTAQVMLLTDERAAAGAVVGQLGQSNALGSVRGLGHDGLLEMRYVSGLEPVKEGDTVFTTGQDQIYPPNLKIGEVVQVKTGSATAYHTIYVKPSVLFKSLDEVAVLQYYPPQIGAPDEALPNVKKTVTGKQ